MAYKQKSEDISGLMMKMKSPLNYGGKSAMMKTGETKETKKTSKDLKTKTTSKDLESSKILKAVGGEEAMAKAYTKQTGSTLYSGPLYEAFKNKYAQDRFGNV